MGNAIYDPLFYNSSLSSIRKRNFTVSDVKLVEKYFQVVKRKLNKKETNSFLIEMYLLRLILNLKISESNSDFNIIMDHLSDKYKFSKYKRDSSTAMDFGSFVEDFCRNHEQPVMRQLISDLELFK